MKCLMVQPAPQARSDENVNTSRTESNRNCYRYEQGKMLVVGPLAINPTIPPSPNLTAFPPTAPPPAAPPPPAPPFLSHRNPVGADDMPLLRLAAEVGLPGERASAQERSLSVRPRRHVDPDETSCKPRLDLISKRGHFLFLRPSGRRAPNVPPAAYVTLGIAPTFYRAGRRLPRRLRRLPHSDYRRPAAAPAPPCKEREREREREHGPQGKAANSHSRTLLLSVLFPSFRVSSSLPFFLFSFLLRARFLSAFLLLSSPSPRPSVRPSSASLEVHGRSGGGSGGVRSTNGCEQLCNFSSSSSGQRCLLLSEDDRCHQLGLEERATALHITASKQRRPSRSWEYLPYYTRMYAGRPHHHLAPAYSTPGAKTFVHGSKAPPVLSDFPLYTDLQLEASMDSHVHPFIGCAFLLSCSGNRFLVLKKMCCSIVPRF